MPQRNPTLTLPVGVALVIAASATCGFSFLAGSAAALPALAIFVLVLEARPSLTARVGLGGLFGLICSVVGLHWCLSAAHDSLGASTLGATVLVVALALIFAFRFVMFALLWHATRAWGLGLTVRLPVLLLVSETATETPFPFHFGYALAELEPINQVAELGGGGALSLVSGILSALLLLLWQGAAQREWTSARTPTAYVGAGVVVAAALFGAARLHGIGMPHGAAVEVAVVHLAQAPVQNGEERVEDMQRLWAMTSAHLRQAAKNVDLTVFPEGVYPILMTQAHTRLRPLEGSRFVAVGGRSSDHDAHYNAAFVAEGTGALVGTHRKERLVPFGEYIPSLLEGPWVRERFPTAGRLRAESHPDTSIDTPGFTLGLSICFEDLFPDLVRPNATLLVNLSNDAPFHSALEAQAHARFAALRAIETRRSMVRATRGGISGVVDPAGRWVARTSAAHEVILLANAPLSHGKTLFSQHGNWPVTIAWIFLILAGLNHAYRTRGPSASITAPKRN